MRSVRILFGLLLVVVLAWIVARPHLRNAAPSIPAREPARIAVTIGDVNKTLQAMATVRPENRVEIRPAMAGRVDEVLVREGEAVKAGQVLARMSSTDRAVLLDAARARGEAELARWQETYRPVSILAPLAGTVIVRNVEPGQTVAPESVLLAVSDHLVVEALADETDLSQIQPGQAARIILDAYPDERLDGAVLRISHEARVVENVTMYGVLIAPARVPEFVRSGMTANVVFDIARRTGVPVLPAEALQDEGDGKSAVYLPGADPAAPPARRPVQTGLSDGRWVEITGGLAPGDEVLVPRLPSGGPARKSPFVPTMSRNPDRNP